MDVSKLIKGQKLICKRSSGPYNWHSPIIGELYEFDGPAQSLDGSEWITIKQITGMGLGQTWTYYADDFEPSDEAIGRPDFIIGEEYTAIRGVRDVIESGRVYKCSYVNDMYVEFDTGTRENPQSRYRALKPYAASWFNPAENYVTNEAAKYQVAREWAKAMGIKITEDE